MNNTTIPVRVSCNCGAEFDSSSLTDVQAHYASADHRAGLVDQRLQRYARQSFEALKWWVHVESTFQTGNDRTAAYIRARDLVTEIQDGFRSDGLIR